MTPERHQEIKRVFLAAIEHPRDRWPAILDEHCANDPDLRREVDLLLNCHVDVRELAGESAAPRPARAERPAPSAQDVGPIDLHTADTVPAPDDSQSPLPMPSDAALHPRLPDATPRAARDLERDPSRRAKRAQELRHADPRHADPRRGSRHRSRSSLTSEQGRFVPGTLIADRYRIIALIGRGGMGEVYRADDLRLGQAVALKFLPHELADHPARIQQLLDEVRVARAISHPNVCNVFDIEEHTTPIGVELFVSMEFVDGETLDSLIARIGRIPLRKAEQLAQQLCAGLSAIHDGGVLHRDLKPANIMIDGRGQLRVNDFGLASIRDVYGLEAIAGTPGFVAPESLAGRAATVRSDIYALGLILYELFTGVPAYRARTREDLIRDQGSTDPDHPSVHAPDLSADIADTIMRCLARDPDQRPASAREVSALLPGGDALAAALAAGETPSPSVVAAAGVRGLLTTVQALAAVLAFLGAMYFALRLSESAALIRRAPIPKSPVVLAERARTILADLGHPLHPHEAYTLDLYDEWLDELVRTDTTPRRATRIARVRPSAIDFWYRSSPTPLLPRNPDGRITYFDPTVIERGMISLRLSAAGHLRELAVTSPDLFWPKGGLAKAESAPPGVTDEPAPEPDVDYAAAFRAAGLDIAKFVEVAPKRDPPVFAEHRIAWVGQYPESPDEPVQVEIATSNNKIVAFRTVELNWQGSQAAVAGLSLVSQAQRLGIVLFIGLQITAIVAAAVLALRNLRQHRVDVPGSIRVALVMGVLVLTHLLLAADTLSGQNEWLGNLTFIASRAIAAAALAWVLYAGFEPAVRRIWPEMLIASTRLLEGRWNDPLVGQSVIMGSIVGVSLVSLAYINRSLPGWLGQTPALPLWIPEFGLGALGDMSDSAASYLHILIVAARFSGIFVAALALTRLIVKRPRLAVVLFGAFHAGVFSLGPSAYTGWWSPLLIGAMVGAALFVLVRYGLLGMIALVAAFHLIAAGPITTDPTAWFYDRSVATLAILTLIALTGAYLSTRATRTLPRASSPLAARP